jgi:hypothetical protein
MSETADRPAMNADGVGRNFTTKWWHDSLIDWLMLNPEKRLTDAAKHFNVTNSYLSILMGSDNFKRAFAARREQFVGEVTRSTEEKLRGLADVTIDCLTERIARERDTIALVDVRETMEAALKASGYGAPKTVAPTTQVNVIVTAEELANARAILQARRREAGTVIDVTPPTAA